MVRGVVYMEVYEKSISIHCALSRDTIKKTISEITEKARKAIRVISQYGDV